MPQPFEYKVSRETGRKVLKISYEGVPYTPSIEDDATCMAQVFDILAEVGEVDQIVFVQQEEYTYEHEQVRLLREIFDVWIKLVRKENILDFTKFTDGACQRFFPAWHDFLQSTVTRRIKEDPIGAYVQLKRRIIEEEIKEKKPLSPQYSVCAEPFITLLRHAAEELERTTLIKLCQPHLPGWKVGDRALYRQFFRPAIRPYFMYTKLTTAFPAGAEEIDSYKIAEGADVLILKVPADIRPRYHVILPEFKLSSEKYALLTQAREVMAEHRPTREEFIDPERTRGIFYSIEKDLLADLAKEKGLNLSYDEIEELAKILVRYTIGFGAIEILLSDKNIQDIVVNAPLGVSPISIIHSDYNECRTNITPSMKEGESWATKLRLISGRPLDEANPVLDTDLKVPGSRARVAAIQVPLSPSGIAYAFRRHRDASWTLPLFIDNGMLTSLAAGVLSFLVDGARTMLIAGTRSSGKTSLLGALMVEISRNSRVITIEDSVAGDCRIVVSQDGRMQKTTIGELIDKLIEDYGAENKFGREVVKNILDIEVFAVDSKGKQKLARASSFIRHRTEKNIFEIETATGRKIKVTEDHSLFGIGEKSVLKEVKIKDLKIGEFLTVPRILSFDNKPQATINLLEHIDKLKGCYIFGPQIKEVVIEKWDIIKTLAKERGYAKSAYSAWKRNAIMPVEILAQMHLPLDPNKLKIKAKAQSKALPAIIQLDKELLTFIGLWLADGCYDKCSVIVSACEPEERQLVKNFAKKFNLETKLHSDKFSLMINSKVLKQIMQEVLDLKGNAYTKKIPNWVYNLSKEQIAYVLRGIFSGDGCAGDKEIAIPLASEQLLADIQTLLLAFGIIFRKRNKQRPDKTFNASISATKFLQIFKKEIGFLQASKNKKLDTLCSRVSTHDTSDIIPLSQHVKAELCLVCDQFNKYDYLTRQNNIGREHLAEITSSIEDFSLLNPLKFLAESDILWDRIVNIKKIKNNGYVYDISVPEYENFVCENILAHNTLELPVAQLRGLNYDIQSLKVRSVITPTEAEVPADQGIRTSLRLGDSALIVGEVRSTEALALWEAMRVGALAKVVAGTIHGDSPYGVFDRVVNDLKVPKTSFKATDIIVVCNPVTSPSGLERWKRVVQISEVRKFWEEDPLREKGFADLFTYDAKEDKLIPNPALTEGESEIIKAIGGRVREWAGNWPAIWENIQLRAKIKQAIVDTARKTGDRNMLEADFVVAANDQFHKISSLIAEEVGYTEPNRVYSEWENWLKDEIKKRGK